MALKDRSRPEDSWRTVGGAACLDFVNTVGGRVSAPGHRGGRDFADQVTRDDLPDYDSLLRWGAFASLLEPTEVEQLRAAAQHAPRAAQGTLQRARRLRESVYRIGKAIIEDWPLPEADLAVLDHEVRQARQHQRLVARPGRIEAEWAEGAGSLDAMLWPVAVSAAMLFASDDLSQLKQCSGSACGWLFVDTTRNHSRQWCEMADCGNLSKMRRFRQRVRKQRKNPR